MRFLVDECTGPKVATWLRKQGFEVFSVYHNARGISDDEVIEKAFIENWILITNDKDFGEKVFREKKPHRGVIFLRLENERASIKIDTINRLLKSYKDRIVDNFTVVTETKVRFARISHFNNN
jgi:predicted nuclease of predicted toxin-antitoxin system